jgi:hypothetical protein
MLPTKSLAQSGEQEAIDYRADIAGCGQTKDQTLHAWRITATSHRQRDRKARAADTEKRAEQEQQCVGRRNRQQ